MIDDRKSMAHLSPENQARKALYHILKRIREDSRVGWYMGFGTESFALATEAIAALDNRDVREVREHFAPENPCDPAEEAREQSKAKSRKHIPPLSEDEGMAVDEILQLLEAQAALDYAAAATDQHHAGFELIQSAERKERLYNELLGIKHKFGVEEFA